ncbi:uncharacterized protein CLUP02_09364 [Colletotrichum lupini]|uniref:Uncharacterized protein n=1 Tax=Colletotrichum lupini TaxID=145971 RepID=A0A9Q8SVA0_9PEZI|nr:uncharacterized protein CLUP02_09364 [Colletotrichum lupini]UQC83868.1 hypothetical protein CLUP02_09364 [Colletotrichum lupini]
MRSGDVVWEENRTIDDSGTLGRVEMCVSQCPELGGEKVEEEFEGRKTGEGKRGADNVCDAMNQSTHQEIGAGTRLALHLLLASRAGDDAHPPNHHFVIG